MTDRELHELLHQRVADLTTRDLSEAAWDRATRLRRRRAAGVVAGAVAAVAVVAVALVAIPGADRSAAPGPGPATMPPASSTSPTPGGDAHADAVPPDRLPGAANTDPDGTFRDRAVFWGPLPSQEEKLPWVTSPFPETIDLSAPAPSLAEQPIRQALAAYALVDANDHARLLLLAPDGSLRSVDTSRVARFEGGAGYDLSVESDTMLSPTGTYLGFQQRDSVLVLTLATGEWRTVDTSASAGVLHWLGESDLWLPSSSQGGEGPIYSAKTGKRTGSAKMSAPSDPISRFSGPTYRWRMGPGGWAQSWTDVDGLPVPDDEETPSQVMRVTGNGTGRGSLLVYRSSRDDRRADLCCGVDFWLSDDAVVYESPAERSSGSSSEAVRRLVAWKVGTHALGQVATVEGYDPAREDLVSSYARIWDR